MTKKETRAIAKYLRMSPFKLRRIARVVRGKSAPEGMAILRMLPHKGARIIEEVLKSAVANATHNDSADAESLKIDRILVNEGPRFKRFQPRARGRVYQITKRTSHVEVAVTSGSEGQ